MSHKHQHGPHIQEWNTYTKIKKPNKTNQTKPNKETKMDHIYQYGPYTKILSTYTRMALKTIRDNIKP